MNTLNQISLGNVLPNGATVVAFYEGAGGGIVLARRDHELHPYVTWAYDPGNDESTTWGHYYEHYTEAWEDFVARVERTK
jgi:hypothetical protein